MLFRFFGATGFFKFGCSVCCANGRCAFFSTQGSLLVSAVHAGVSVRCFFANGRGGLFLQGSLRFFGVIDAGLTMLSFNRFVTNGRGALFSQGSLRFF